MEKKVECKCGKLHGTVRLQMASGSDVKALLIWKLDGEFQFIGSETTPSCVKCKYPAISRA